MTELKVKSIVPKCTFIQRINQQLLMSFLLSSKRFQVLICCETLCKSEYRITKMSRNINGTKIKHIFKELLPSFIPFSIQSISHADFKSLWTWLTSIIVWLPPPQEQSVRCSCCCRVSQQVTVDRPSSAGQKLAELMWKEELKKN